MVHAEVLDLGSFRARHLIEDGKHYISQGDLDLAVEALQKSISLAPSPEGLTYLGWVLSLKGHANEAIELCQRAISLDPQYGSALNDLGSYLVQKGLLEDAIPLFERAKLDSRYDLPHFPYINLGRVYSALGHIEDAVREFKLALSISPNHPEILAVLDQLLKVRN